MLVQATRNACGISVVTHYRELSKFNIRKLTEVEGTEARKKDAGGSAKKPAAAASEKADTSGEREQT